jgi:hypothetical protein
LAVALGFSLGSFGLFAFPFGCGSDSETGIPLDAGGDGADGGADGPQKEETVTLHPDAPPLPGETSCEVVMTTGISVSQAHHVALCTPVDYPTNPPSGGDHWPQWATYQKHTDAVPREMLVHNMEHGGVVLWYKCTDACPEVVAALEEVYDGAKSDCPLLTNSAHARMVLVADPKLDTPIAASAWGATYTATCIDTESLAGFVAKVYGHGPEPTVCGDGFPVPACDGG